jgi:Zn-dependent protease with chaperone function
MRYYVLLGFLAAGAYAGGAVLTAGAVSLAWARYQTAAMRIPSHTRAQLLAAMRFAPLAVGIALSAALSGVFLRFEPRATAESPGLLLIVAATAAAILFLAAASRAFRAVAAGRRCIRLLRSCGTRADAAGRLPLWIVDTPYPIAAVTGVLRPRLLVSARIVRECPPEEIDAILRHEAAHVRRRDNLLRALMLAAPDPLLFGATGRALHSAWAAAAEQAADDEAAGDRPDVRADLAAALIRVARMVQGPPPAWAAGVAFYEGSNLEERVQRLLAPAAAGGRARTWLAAATVLIVAAFAAVAADPIAFRVHSLMEAAVNRLP